MPSKPSIAVSRRLLQRPPRLDSAPDEVRDLLGGETFPNCESPSLRLEKFVRIGDNTKRAEIDAVVDCQNKKGVASEGVPVPQGGVQFPATLKSRLIVNQAGGILENAGLCLHPHFGYPYIPGSAVKGVARHAAWCEWDEAKDEKQKVELAKRIAHVFGYPTNDDDLDKFLEDLGDKERRSGCISFWAATPETKARLVTDIVNCHHPKYYASKDAYATASDDEQPNPQFFPAVEKGATFLFTLVPMRGAAGDDLVHAKAWLIKAIQESGVGAKTSAGYGWFGYSKEAEEKRTKDAEAKHAEEARKNLVQQLSGRIAALAAMDENDEVFAKEVAAIDAVMKDAKLPQSDIDAFNKQKRRVPQASLQDTLLREWSGKKSQDCALTHYVMQFKAKSEKDKAEIVSVLRTHKVWKYLKAGNFTDLKKKHQAPLREQVEAIRAFAKTTPEGKMP